ncbi:MAG: helix-turn-helix domain-containing protein [Pseudomonadota bacterium]
MNPHGKRTAIMEAGESLFAERGYAGTSIADIAKEANVAVGSIYRLFPDKPSLLAALHQRMERQFIAVMTDAWHSVEPYEDKFEPLIQALLSEALRLREIMPLYSMTKDMIGAGGYVPGAEMMETIETFYNAGVRVGAFRPIPNGILGPLAHSMVEGGMRALMMKPTAKHQNSVQSELLEVFQKAFLTSSG